jgi:DNA-binding MarR family transcriptional regulator
VNKPAGTTNGASVALSDLVAFDLYAATLAVTRAYRTALIGLGLTYPQYLVMVALWQHSPRTVTELGEPLGLDSGTLSPLLKRLEAAGLVTRRRRTDDERTVEITPTAKGRALERPASKVPVEMKAVMGITADEERKLRVLLRKLSGSLGRQA